MIGLKQFILSFIWVGPNKIGAQDKEVARGANDRVQLINTNQRTANANFEVKFSRIGLIEGTVLRALSRSQNGSDLRNLSDISGTHP